MLITCIDCVNAGNDRNAIVAGYYNKICDGVTYTAADNLIGAGRHNTASGCYNFIGAGRNNKISQSLHDNFIGGGCLNKIGNSSADKDAVHYNFIGAGLCNKISSYSGYYGSYGSGTFIGAVLKIIIVQLMGL